MANETAEKDTVVTLADLQAAIAASVREGVASSLNPLQAQLSDATKSWHEGLAKIRIDGGPEQPAALQTGKEAQLAESGMLASVTGIKVWDIPVGEAAAGGFVAILASELIDGVLSKQSKQVKAIVKLVGAGAAVKWGGKFLGSTGSKAVALLLAFDAIRDMTPLDDWANKMANKLSGVIPVGGLGDQRGPTPTRGEAPRAPVGAGRDYYSGMAGR